MTTATKTKVTVLGHMTTDVGRISLVHVGGHFETRRTYFDAITGDERETIIPESREDAEWWHEEMERHGAVFGPFPEEMAP